MRSDVALRNCFSRLLREALERRYKKIPSAAFIAKEFNLRSTSTTPVTAEAARRWLRGISIPEFDKLVVLRNWLSLDLNLICIEVGVVNQGDQSNQTPRAIPLLDQGRFFQIAMEIDCNVELLLSELENYKKSCLGN